MFESVPTILTAFRPQSPHAPPTAKISKTCVAGITNQITIANNIAASHTRQLLRRRRVLWVSGAPIPPAAQTANPSVEPTPDTLHRGVRTQKHLVHSHASIAPFVSLAWPWRRACCDTSDRGRRGSRGLPPRACRPTHGPWSKLPCFLSSGVAYRSRLHTIRICFVPCSAARTGSAVSNLPDIYLGSLAVLAFAFLACGRIACFLCNPVPINQYHHTRIINGSFS